MAVIGVTGGLGAGKSLTSVLLAYDEHLRGQPVISNGPLQFPVVDGLVPPRRVESWLDVVSFRSGTFLWDESHLDIDSREFQRHVGITAWITQLRKLGVNLLYVTQSWDQVDKRLRNLTDKLLLCSPLFDGEARGTEVLTIDVFRERKLGKVVIRHQDWMYGLYDSYAPIFPLSGKIPDLRSIWSPSV